MKNHIQLAGYIGRGGFSLDNLDDYLTPFDFGMQEVIKCNSRE
jgi:hypothetical protein